MGESKPYCRNTLLVVAYTLEINTQQIIGHKKAKTYAVFFQRKLNYFSMMLIYLTRFAEGEPFKDASTYYAWKGYNFDVLGQLEEEKFISQGAHPSRAKRVYLTEAGLSEARQLLEKYNVSDWEACS